jgi:hypothetical protein
MSTTVQDALSIVSNTVEAFTYTPRLLAVDARLQDVEAQQIEMMRDWSLEEKVNFYSFKPASDEALTSMARNSEPYRVLNGPFRDRAYVTPPNVGPIMQHRWLHTDMTYGDWKALYLTEVLPYPSLIQLALRVNRDLRKDKSIGFEKAGVSTRFMNRQFALNVLCNRTYKQSNDGFQREFFALQEGSKSDPTLRRAIGDEDSKKHLDLVAASAAYQVKPNSFVCRTLNSGLLADQKANIRSQRLYEFMTGVPVFYLLHSDLDAGIFNPISLADIASRCGLTDFYEAIREPKPVVVAA